MKNKFSVTKSSGLTEPFSIKKLRSSLAHAKASPGEIDTIVKTLLPKLYQGISTKKINAEAFRLLRHHSKIYAARYHLKQGIMELGPTGFPFERLMGKILQSKGYEVNVGEIVSGKCVNHEIDVMAKKENNLILMECKYHNQSGIAVDVKTPLYIHSRFEDVLANGLLKNKSTKFEGWIATNSKFTNDAIDYATCKGMHLISWNYPNSHSLRNTIDQTGLYPLTCLTSLTRQEKQWLLAKNYILASDIFKDTELLKQAGVSNARLKSVYEEGYKLCNAVD